MDVFRRVALFGQLSGQGVGGFVRNIEKTDLGTLFGKMAGDRFTDSAAATGDDYRFARKAWVCRDG